LSVTVTIQVQVKPDKLDEFLDFLRKNLPDTRAFPGCESIILHQNQDDPTTFIYVQRWAARTDQEAYVAWRTEQGVFDAFVDMLASEPMFGYYDAVDV
jgi:quinol monooxygenase YgiN